MHGVVVLHPIIDESERGGGIRDRTDPDVIAFEGLHEGLGHTVAFWAFDRGEARGEIKRQGDRDSPVGSEYRTVIGQPLHRIRRAERAETLLDAADHHVADHLAGDAGGRRNPGDRLAVVAVEGERDTHGVAVPAGEFQRIGAPAAIRPDRRHLAVVLACSPASGMAFEQKAMLLHQPVDALSIDRGQTVEWPLALEERGDPPVPVRRTLVDKAADFASKLDIAGALLWAAPRPLAVPALDDIRAGHTECRADYLHRVSPGSGEGDSKIGFFARVSSSASLRISTSIVLRPSRRSSSRTRSSRRRTSEAATTSSSARTASLPPSLINCLQRNTKLGESPWRRAT